MAQLLPSHPFPPLLPCHFVSVVEGPPPTEPAQLHSAPAATLPSGVALGSLCAWKPCAFSFVEFFVDSRVWFSWGARFVSLVSPHRSETQSRVGGKAYNVVHSSSRMLFQLQTRSSILKSFYLFINSHPYAPPDGATISPRSLTYPFSAGELSSDGMASGRHSCGSGLHSPPTAFPVRFLGMTKGGC